MDRVWIWAAVAALTFGLLGCAKSGGDSDDDMSNKLDACMAEAVTEQDKTTCELGVALEEIDLDDCLIEAAGDPDKAEDC